MTTTLKKMPERKCHHRPLVRRQCHQWLENQIKPYRNRRQIIKRQTKASLSASEKAAASTTTMMTIPTVLQVKILIYFLFPLPAVQVDKFFIGLADCIEHYDAA